MLVTLIFIEGYWAPGLTVGLRFGLPIGLFAWIPMAYAGNAVMPIGDALAFPWFVCGTVPGVVPGVVEVLTRGPPGRR